MLWIYVLIVSRGRTRNEREERAEDPHAEQQGPDEEDHEKPMVARADALADP
jgi:hypothetical protein